MGGIAGKGAAGGELSDIVTGRCVAFGMACAFAELIGDFPTGDLEQPAFERVFGGIVLEVGDFLGDGEENVLKGFIGFMIAQAGTAGDAEDESAIGFMEFGPARIGSILDRVQKARAGRQWVIRHHWLQNEQSPRMSKLHSFQIFRNAPAFTSQR
ncbi:MAG: hypothetical protein JWM99_1211 [Verrucomicrobiales bacterium]|nr:hypothetical protein [Verrucomicrobiales bacterium]